MWNIVHGILNPSKKTLEVGKQDQMRLTNILMKL